MADAIDVAVAVVTLRRGGVIAYPTESVWGLGCDPHNETAVARLFALKQRPAGLGVVLIGAELKHVAVYIEPLPAAAMKRVLSTWPGPHTWIFPRNSTVPSPISGEHAGIAVRVTAHPQAAALCRAFGGAIVSTSANRHGAAAARSAVEVRSIFGDELDFVLDGALGGLALPTTIRDAATGETLRP